jgi:hypothetical protein
MALTLNSGLGEGVVAGVLVHRPLHHLLVEVDAPLDDDLGGGRYLKVHRLGRDHLDPLPEQCPEEVALIGASELAPFSAHR